MLEEVMESKVAVVTKLKLPRRDQKMQTPLIG
jgi:hypothetical protein